eukprot:evm.model.scf_263.6 EVM.evm.TU.scf_263.6   scf_263:53477-59707(+)
MDPVVADGDWLKAELTKLLGWDQCVVEGVLAAIDAADTRCDADEIVTNYMDDSSAARSLVHRFLDHKARVLEAAESSAGPHNSDHKGTGKASHNRQAGGRKGENAAGAGKSESGTSVQSSRRNAAGSNTHSQSRGEGPSSIAKQQKSNKGHVSEAPNGAHVVAPVQWATSQASTAASSVAQQGTSRGKQAGPKGKRRGNGGLDKLQLTLTDSIERKVANCLKCGKIYDCRKMSEAIIKFLESGGICSFCGNQVTLTSNGETVMPQTATGNQLVDLQNSKGVSAAEAGESNQEASSSVSVSKMDEAASRAAEFKDRLVEYDRNAAKRTTVIDDQSDYFEVDSNVWLSEQERRDLRQRLDREQELENSRRRNVRYTIDIVGRKVLIAEESKPSQDAQTASEAASRAAEATLQEAPQGGGAAAAAALDTAARAGTASVPSVTTSGTAPALRDLRAGPNPNLPMPAPLFLPRHQDAQNGAKARGSQTQSRGTRPGGGWRVPSSGRLQHDDIFADFEQETAVEVLYDNLGQVPELQAPEAPFNLCPPRADDAYLPEVVRPVSAAPQQSINAKLSSVLMPSSQKGSSPFSGPPPKLVPLDQLPDGMVLLRGWLDVDTQVKIVQCFHKLGMGEGGFYTPTYAGGAELHVRMMCLGKHWDLRDRVYSDVRSIDGSRIPPIPPWLAKLVADCLSDASAARKQAFPKMETNVAIANFYASDGYLGLHQDKEEGRRSCRAGVPVVSFSIGASADFVFNNVQSMQGASYVELQSGDALVFGGPSRMIYHGVSKVYPERTCEEVVRRTGLLSGRLNLTFRQYIPDDEA